MKNKYWILAYANFEKDYLNILQVFPNKFIID